MTAGTVVVSVSPKDLQRARCRCRYTLQGGSWRDVQRILAISEIYSGDACMTITGEMNQELIYNFSGLYATAQRKAPARRRRRNHAPRPLLVATPLEEGRRARKVKTEREQGKGSFVFLELKDGAVFVQGAGAVEAKKGGAAGGGDDGRHHHRHNQAVQSAVARERRRRISNGRAVATAGKRRQRRTVNVFKFELKVFKH
ncbi:hypothetical protein OsJ_06713 [Oryza sativa Japonica Group]|uniref:Uncharacterized protein n=1 Tax=Oryza sativa subsp. japonica TaxID=39947 RepID=B9EZZ1_ORYSJ|nr:hypothetical protein OsJ_06713 [Oryza sativa Japonica Group]